MFRPEKPEQKNEPVVVEVPEKKKKKHKSRKHKTTEGEAWTVIASEAPKLYPGSYNSDTHHIVAQVI